MDAEEYLTIHFPDIILVLASILAILIVYYYRDNELSKAYKATMCVGAIAGVVMIVLDVLYYEHWNSFTAIVVALMGFTMMVRPFREINVAIAIAIFAMIVVFVLMGNCATIEGLEALATGWPRAIVTLIAGAFVYMLASFVENLVMLFGKILNWWPLLLVLAAICLLEACCLFAGYGSFYDLIKS